MQYRFFFALLFFGSTLCAQSNDSLFSWPDTTIYGEKIDLELLKKSNVIILFYASWNESSRVVLKNWDNYISEINANKKNFSNIQFIAFSLDSRPEELTKVLSVDKIQQAKIYCDYLNWDSPLTSQFNVNAIPHILFYQKAKKLFDNPGLDDVKRAIKK